MAGTNNLFGPNGWTPDRIGSLAGKTFVITGANTGGPEVLCATEKELRPEALHGPTKRAETVGPIGECPLEDHVADREAAARLWQVSEEKTDLIWSPPPGVPDSSPLGREPRFGRLAHPGYVLPAFDSQFIASVFLER